MTKTGKPSLPPFKKSCVCFSGIFLFVPALCILLAGAGWAADIQVTASVDKRELTLEESLNFSITVKGTTNAPRPELPTLDSFHIRSGGSSATLQIINGTQTSSVTFTYRLLPQATGTFTIGPATVVIGGKTYRSEPITLVVKAPSKTVDRPKEVFVELRVSNPKPYVQEQVTATLRVYHRVGLRNLSADLKFPGFRKEKLKGPVRTTRVVNGIGYRVFEIPTALFPLSAGRIEIPAGIVEFDEVKPANPQKPFDPFDPLGPGSIFKHATPLEHKTLRTKATTLEVQPLPVENRPADFSNLVGTFKISARLSRSEVEVGDTATLTVTVAGRGNIQDLALPSPDWGENFKAYQDQSAFHQTHTSQAISGEKVFTFALVPLKTGPLTVPPIGLTYFDPERADYVTAQSPALSITALPGKKDAQMKIEDADSGPQLAEDILPIHTGAVLFENHRLAPGSGWLYGLGLMVPPGLFLVYAWNYRHRQRLKHDIAFSRSHGAYKQALKKLAALSHECDSPNIARELSLIVREYLGNILNLQGTAITSREVEEKLNKGGAFSTEAIEATQKLLEHYETLQYASSPADQPEGLIQESRRLLERLEKKS